MKKLGSLLKKFWFKIKTDKDTRGATIFVGLCVIFYVIFLIIINTDSTMLRSFILVINSMDCMEVHQFQSRVFSLLN